jgi:arginase
MPVAFLVVPQWQGSGSSRAMRLVDGAEAIRGDLPAASTRVISIALVRDRLTDALAETSDPAITIGGDCGVELGAVGRVLGDPTVAVVWLDAHPDLNSPESSPSGAFHGMILRTVLGDGPEQLVPGAPLDPSRLVLAGVRAADEQEDAYLAGSGIRSIGVDELDGASLVAAVEATGASSVYVHIDLDVLDPGDFSGLGFPEPFGVRATTLVEALRALLARFPLAGAGITEFAPASPEEAVEDLPTILRLIGALSAG